MFNKLKGMLDSKPAAKPAARGPFNPNFVTDPSRIQSLLNDVVHQRAVLFLCLSDSEEETDEMVTTYLYKIGPSRAAIQMVDSPEEDERIRAAGKFKVITDVFDRVLTFPAEILDVQKEGEQSYYIVKIPERVYHPESGRPRRIRLGQKEKIPAYLKFYDAAKTMPGTVDDLGHTGLGVLMAAEETLLPFVRKGEELRGCSIGLGSKQYAFDARITHVKRVSEKTLRLDCSFNKPSKELERAIEGLFKNR